MSTIFVKICKLKVSIWLIAKCLYTNTPYFRKTKYYVTRVNRLHFAEVKSFYSTTTHIESVSLHCSNVSCLPEYHWKLVIMIRNSVVIFATSNIHYIAFSKARLHASFHLMLFLIVNDIPRLWKCPVYYIWLSKWSCWLKIQIFQQQPGEKWCYVCYLFEL